MRDFAGFGFGWNAGHAGGAEPGPAPDVRGTIISLARFRSCRPYAVTYNPTFCGFTPGTRDFGFPVPYEEQDASGAIGDAAVPGKGELLIWKPRAS